MPDGSVKKISHKGQVTLDSGLKLINVLYVHSFHYNLLSVSQLSRDNGFEVIFGSNHCCIHDHRFKEVKVVAWLVDGLYLIDHTSFNDNLLNSIHSCNSAINIECRNKFQMIHGI